VFGVFREHVTNKRQLGETDGLDTNSLMCLVGYGAVETMNHLFIECVFFIEIIWSVIFHPILSHVQA